MRDPADRSGGWLALGRLLPREVRERVFEPACLDAFGDAVRSGHATRHPHLRIAVLVVESLRVSLPGLFFRNRRLTRLGRVAVATTMFAVLVISVAARMGGMYASPPAP